MIFNPSGTVDPCFFFLIIQAISSEYYVSTLSQTRNLYKNSCFPITKAPTIPARTINIFLKLAVCLIGVVQHLEEVPFTIT